jgi:asparagine N-glycosylation enzyme membrane subunit Stt3
MKKFSEIVGAVVLVLLTVAGLLLAAPIIYIGFGYLGGLVVQWIFGGLITDGLNLIFRTDKFQEHHIPIITATLAMIGSYFKSNQTSNNK